MKEIKPHIRIFKKDEFNIVQVDTWELKDFLEDYYREECGIDYDFYQDVNPELAKFNNESYNLFFPLTTTEEQLLEFTTKLSDKRLRKIVKHQKSQFNGKFFCPCCGYNTLDKYPKESWEICEYCFWENDPIQNSDPYYESGANQPSLINARINYNQIGACHSDHKNKVKEITDDLLRNPNYEINTEFVTIEPFKIISYCEEINSSMLLSKKPTVLIKTEYKYGQTIVLKGTKSEFINLIEFWISCQAWYSDGYDSLFKDLIFDDLTSYNGWKTNANRVGNCNPLQKENYSKLVKFIGTYDSSIKIEIGLEMDSNWNNQKILFTEGVNYYLYFFWTGE